MWDMRTIKKQASIAHPTSHVTHQTPCAAMFPRALLVIVSVLFPLIFSGLSSASEPNAWYEKFSPEWGGHIRGRGTVSWPDDETIQGTCEPSPDYDGTADFRIKNKVFFGQWGYFDTHYEAVFWGGDSWRTARSLEELYPGLLGLFGAAPDDGTSLMDLTWTDANDDYLFYHRIDRLALTVQQKWGALRIGRQALTWGNGLIFNPMDLFNPFEPTDILRDYKVGEDMVTADFTVQETGGLQLVYVPRRNPISDDVAWDQSSLGGKWHFALGTTEFDVMAAKSYEDYVAGLGGTGYLGDAAWRMDGTWTFLNEDSSDDGFLSLVANIDYSWVWLDKNMYGLIEFYFNGLGTDDYGKAYSNPDILIRLIRGEMFTIGRTYLAGELRMELHPLFSVYLSVINNMADPSGVLQPRAIWDLTGDLQMTFGGSVYYGAARTEYGGFELDDTGVFTKPANSAFFWLTCFF